MELCRAQPKLGLCLRVVDIRTQEMSHVKGKVLPFSILNEGQAETREKLRRKLPGVVLGGAALPTDLELAFPIREHLVLENLLDVPRLFLVLPCRTWGLSPGHPEEWDRPFQQIRQKGLHLVQVVLLPPVWGNLYFSCVWTSEPGDQHRPLP